MGILNPLTEHHCNDIDAILRAIPSIRETIAAHEECGADHSSEKEQLNAIEHYATTAKKRFNPLAE